MPELLETDHPRQARAADRRDTGAATTHPPGRISGLPPAGIGSGDERAVRGELRRQIARLEREIGELFGSTFPRKGISWTVGAAGGPRVLGIAELERVRDRLADRIAEARAEVARRADAEEANRALVERMIADPAEHRWVRVSNEDVGEPGCKHWHSRPRWGILGMLAGWWRVKLSSGCPLATGRGSLPPAPRPSRVASKSSKRRRKRRQSAASRAPGSGAASGTEPTPAAAPAPPRRAAPRNVDDERPPAPWGSFPLIELTVLVGIVMLILGFAVFEGERRAILIGTGLLLGSIGGLDLSIREHFAGYRSHTLVLAGLPAIAVLAVLFYIGPDGLPSIARAAIALAVFAAAATLLIRAFRRRSGGQSFRLSGLRNR